MGESQEQAPQQRRGSWHRGDGPEEGGSPTSNSDGGGETELLAAATGAGRRNPLRATDLCRRGSSLTSLSAGGGAAGRGDSEAAAPGPRYHLVSPLAAAGAHGAAVDGRLSSTSNTTLSVDRDSSESGSSRHSPKNSFSDDEGGAMPKRRAGPDAAAAVRPVSVAGAGAAGGGEAGGPRWKTRVQGGVGVGLGAAAMAQQHQLDNLALPVSTAAGTDGPAYMSTARGRWVQRPRNPALVAAAVPSPVVWRRGPTTEEACRRSSETCVLLPPAENSGSVSTTGLSQEAAEDAAGNGQLKMQGAAENLDAAECPAGAEGGAAAEEAAAAKRAAGAEGFAAAPEAVPAPAALELAVAAPGKSAAAAPGEGDETAEDVSDLLSSEDSVQTSRLLSKRSAWSRRSTTGAARDSNPEGEGARACLKTFTADVETEEEEEVAQAAAAAGVGQTSSAAAAAENADESMMSEKGSRAKHILPALVNGLLASCCCCVTSQLWQDNRWLPERWRRRRGCRCVLQVLLLLLLLLLLFLPIFFSLLMPHIIASYVKGGGVKVLSTAMRKQRPDGFEAAVTVQFLTYVPLHVEVADTRVDVFTQDQRVGRTAISSFTLDRNTEQVTFASDFFVEDLSAWENFLRELFTRGSSEWRMQGSCTVKFLGLTYRNIPFNKVLEIEGPTLSASDDGETPFVVKQIDMSSSTPRAIVARVSVEYNNSSTSSVESIGIVKFAMLYNGYPVGMLTSVGPIGMQLGSNAYTFVASMSHQDVTQILRAPAAAAAVAAANARSRAGSTAGGAGQRRLAANPPLPHRLLEAGNGDGGSASNPARNAFSRTDSSGSHSSGMTAEVLPAGASGPVPGGGAGKSSGSSGAATGDAEVIERSLGSHSSEDDGEALSDTSPEDSAGKKKFLQALSQLTNAALSGDTTAKVVCVGIDSSEPLFAGGMQALLMESALQGLFDDNEGENGAEQGERRAGIKATERKKKRKGERSSPFFKGMKFHKFSLAPPADAEAPPDDADVTAEVVVRFLNPLGTAHRFTIQKVEVQAVLRHRTAEGRVLGHISGEMLPRGPPQPVASLDAPFVRIPPAGDSRAGDAAGGRGNAAGKRGRGRERGGGDAGATGDRDAARRPHREKKYNYPDLAEARKEEEVPADLSPEEWNSRTAYFADDEAMRLAAVPDPWPAHADDVDAGGEEEDAWTLTAPGSSPGAVPDEAAASARQGRQAWQDDEDGKDQEQRGRPHSGNAGSTAATQQQSGAPGAQQTHGLVNVSSEEEEEEGQERLLRPSPSSQSNQALQQKQQQQKPQKRGAAEAVDGGTVRRLAAWREEGEGRAKQEGKTSSKLPHASVMDLTFTMRGRLQVLDGGAAFAEFMREMASQEKVGIAFTETHARLSVETGVGTLQLNDVQLDGEEQLDGMASMRNVTVESFDVLGEVDGGRTWLLETRVLFPSDAPTSVYIGDLGFALAFEGVPLGWMAGRNVRIEEGGNAMQFVGMLQPPPEAAETVSRFFSAALAPAEDDDEEDQKEEEQGAGDAASEREDQEETDGTLKEMDKAGEETQELLLHRAPQGDTLGNLEGGAEEEAAGAGGDGEVGEGRKHEEEGEAAGEWRGSSSRRKGTGLSRKREQKRTQKPRPIMEVVVTSEAIGRVNDTLEAAAAQEGRIARYVATLLHPRVGEEEEEEDWRAIPWISRGLEDMQLLVPCPTIGSASDMIQRISMREMRLDLTSNAAKEEGKTGTSAAAASPQESRGRLHVGEEVALAGVVELIVSNPLGSRLIPRIEGVEMDVLLLAALPAEEAAVVPTPSGRMQPVAGFGHRDGAAAAAAADRPLSGEEDAAPSAATGPAAAVAADSRVAAAGDGAAAPALLHKVPVGRMAAVLSGVTVTPLTTAAARAMMAAAAAEEQLPAARTSSFSRSQAETKTEREPEAPAGLGNSDAVSSSPGDSQLLTSVDGTGRRDDAASPTSGGEAGSAATAAAGDVDDSPAASGWPRTGGPQQQGETDAAAFEGDEEEEEEPGAMLLLRVPLSASLQLTGDGENFTDFVVAVFQAESVQVTFRGEAACRMRTGFGEINVKGIDVSATVPVKGLQGLQGSTVTSLSIEGTGLIDDYVRRKRRAAADGQTEPPAADADALTPATLTATSSPNAEAGAAGGASARGLAAAVADAVAAAVFSGTATASVEMQAADRRQLSAVSTSGAPEDVTPRASAVGASTAAATPASPAASPAAVATLGAGGETARPTLQKATAMAAADGAAARRAAWAAPRGQSGTRSPERSRGVPGTPAEPTGRAAAAGEPSRETQVDRDSSSDSDVDDHLLGEESADTFSSGAAEEEETGEEAAAARKIAAAAARVREQGLLLSLEVEMRNNGDAAVALGCLDVDLFHQGVRVGRMSTNSCDASLNPGLNKLAFCGGIILSPETETAVSSLFSRSVRDENLDVQTRTASSCAPTAAGGGGAAGESGGVPQERPRWLTRAMDRVQLMPRIPPFKELLPGMNVADLLQDFDLQSVVITDIGEDENDEIVSLPSTPGGSSGGSSSFLFDIATDTATSSVGSEVLSDAWEEYLLHPSARSHAWPSSSRLPDVAARQLLRRQQQLRESSSDSPASSRMARDASSFSSLANAIAAATAARNALDVEAGETKPGPAAGQHPEEAGDPAQSGPKGRKLSAVRTGVDTSNSPAVVCPPPSSPDEAAARRRPLQDTTRKLPGQPGSPGSGAANPTLSGPQRQLPAVANSSSLFNDAQSSLPSHRSPIAPGHAATVHSSSFRASDASAGASTSEEEPESRGAAVVRSRSATAIDATPEDDAAACASSVPLLRSVPGAALGTASFAAESTAGERAAGFVSAHKRSLPGDVRPGAGEETARFSWWSHSGDAGGRAYAARHGKGGGDVFGSSSVSKMSPSSSFSTNSSAPCFAPGASSSSAVGPEGPEASAHVAACGRVLGSRIGSPADSLLTGRRLAGASSSAGSAAVRALASQLSGVHECTGPWCAEQQQRRRSEAEEESERSEQGERGEESVPHRLVFSALSHVHAKHPFGQKVVPMRVKAVSFEAVVFSGAAVAAAAEAAKQQQQGASEQPRLPPDVAPLGRLVIPLTAVLPAVAPADTAEGRAAGAAAEAPVGAAAERRLGDQGPPSTSNRPTSGERSTVTDTSRRQSGTGAAAAAPADETTVLPAEEEDRGGDGSVQNAAVAATPDGNMDFSFELQRAVLLLEDAGEPLGAAIAAFLKHPDAGFPLFMKGTAGVQVDMGNGLATLSIQGIPVDRFFTLGDKREPATAATAAEEEDGLASSDKAETAESEVLFNTSLQTFHFDGLHPEGGLRFSAVAQMKNSMPVAMVLPSLLFSLYYKDALLGYVWTRDGLRMQPFPEPTEISLRGQLLHQTDSTNLSRLNELAEAILARSSLGNMSPSAGNAAAGDAAGTAAVPASADRPRVTVRPWLDRKLLRSFMEEDWLLSQQASRPAGAGAAPEDAGEAAAEERAWPRPATTPLWLQRALHALEVLAPVESEKLFPTSGFVKQVHMRRVAVRVDGGPLDAIHVDADVLLQLVNPFDGVSRPPVRRGASPAQEHGELPSLASPPPAAEDIPTFAIQSLRLDASIGAADACAADDEGAVSSTAGSAAAAADLDGRSGRRREAGTAAPSQSREKSSSSSVRATTCNAAIFGSLRTPVLDFTEDGEQETLRSFSPADFRSPPSPTYFASGRGPGTATASSSLSSERASFENFGPSALPFHGRVLAAVDDKATAAAETAPPAGMPPGSLMAAAGERQRPPAPAAQAAAGTEPAAHASRTAEAGLRPRVPPSTGEKVTGAAPAVDDAFRASGSSAKWPAYQAARPVGEANDRGFSGWGGLVIPEDTARSARTPAEMQRHTEEWNERWRLREQILQAQRQQQEEQQLNVAALTKLDQKTRTGLLQQQQQKHYAAEGGYGVHQGSYSLNNLFGPADPSRRALIEGGARARGGWSSSPFDTATAVGRRGLTCVPLNLYEQQQQTERDEGPDRDWLSGRTHRERELQLQLEQLQQERQQLPKAREDAWWQQHEAKMGEVRQELEELQQRRRTLETAREKDVGACMLALPFEGEIEVLDETAFVNFALQSVTATQPAFPCTAPQRGGGRAAAGLDRESGLVRADEAGDSSSTVVGCMGGSSGRAYGGVVVDGSAAVVVETPLGRLRVNRVPVQQHLEFVQMRDIVQSAAHGVKMLNFEILNVTFGDAQGVDSISFRANVALGQSGDDGSSTPSFAPDGGTVAEGDGAGPQGRRGELQKTGNDLLAIAERPAETSNRNEGSNSSTQFEVHAGTLTLDLLMEGQAVGAIVAKNIVLGRRNQGSSVSKAAAAATAGSNEEAEDADAPPAVQVEGILKDVSRHRGTEKSKLLQLMQSAVSGRPLPLLLRSAQKQQVPRPAWLLKIIDSMQVTPSLSGLMSSLALVESMRLTQVKINVLDSRRLGIDAVVKVSANNPLNSSQVEVRLEDFSADVRLFQQVQPEARNNEEQQQERQLQHEEGKKQEGVLLGVLSLAQRAIPKSSMPATTTDGTQLQFEVPLSYEKYGDQLVLEGGGEAFGEYITRVIHSSESLASATAAAAKAPAAAGESEEAVEASDAEEPATATAAAMGYVRYEAVVNARLMTTFGPLQIENFPVSAEVNILESLLPAGGEGLIAEKQEPLLQQRKPQDAQEPQQQQQHGRRPAAAPAVLKGRGLVNGVTFDVRSLRFDGDSEPAVPAAAASAAATPAAAASAAATPAAAASAAATPAAAAFLKHIRAASRAAQAERQKKESSEVEEVPQTGVGFSADVALQLPLDVDVSLGTLIFALEIPTAPYAQDSDTASATGSPAAAVDDAGPGSAVARASVQAEREGAAAAVAAARQPRVLSTPGSASSERRLAGTDHEKTTAGTDVFTRKAAAARRAGGEGGEKATAAAAETSPAAQRRAGRHGEQQHQQEDPFFEVEAETVPLGWLVLPSMAVEAGKQTVLQAHGFLLPPADALPLVSKFFSACVRGEEPVVVVKGVAALLPTAREEEAAAVAARAAAAVAARDGEKDVETAEMAEGTVVWLQRLVQSLRVPAPVPPTMRGFVTDSFADLEMRHLSLSAVAPAVLGRDDRVAIGAAVSARIASPLGPQSPLVLHRVAVDVVLHRKKSPGHRSDPFQQQLQQPQADDQQQLPQSPEPRQQEERETLRRGVQRFTTADPGDGELSTGSSRRRLAAPVTGAQGDEAETVGDAELSAAAGGGGEEAAAAGGPGEGRSGETESDVDEADLEMVGSLQISSLPFRQTDAMLEAEVKEALLMLHDNGDAFAEVALGLLNTRETLSLYVRGTTSVVVDTALGRLQLQGLPLSVPVPVAGMSLFDGNALGALAEGALDKLRVWDIEDDEWPDSSTAAAEAAAADVAAAPPGSGATRPRTGEGDDEEGEGEDDEEEEKEGSGAFHLATQLNLHNTNDVYAALGDMVFDVTYEGQTIAAVVVSNFRMQPGDNELFLEGVVKPQGVAAFSALASAFFVNKQYTLGVRGVGGGEDDAGAASAAGVPAANAAADRPRPLAHAEEGSGRAAAAAAAGGNNSSSSSFAGSSVRPSEAALLAMRRCGITTRPPRWLRLVLSRVQFAVPISGRGGNEAGGGASGDSSGTDGDFSVSKLVREVQVLSVDVDFSGPRDPVIGGDLRVFYDMPHNFQIRHTVLSLTSTVTLIHESHKNGDRLIGSMHVHNVRPTFSGQMPADVRLEQLERRQPERQLQDVREEGDGDVEALAVVQQQQNAAGDPLQGRQLKKSSLLRKFSQKIKAKRQPSSESAKEPPSPTVSEQSLLPTSVSSSSSISSSSASSPVSLSAPDFAAAEQQQKQQKQTAKERLKRWASFGKRNSSASTSTESAEAEEQPQKPHRKPKWNPLASKKRSAAAAAEQQPTASSHPPGPSSPLRGASGGREEARVVEEQQRQPQEENASAASFSAWQQTAASSSETETPGGGAGGQGSTTMQRTLESWRQWKEKRRGAKKQKEQSGGSLRRKLAAAYGVVDDDDDEEADGDPDEHEAPWRSAAAAAAAAAKDLPDASENNSDSRGDAVTRAAAAGSQGASKLSPSESNAWSDDAEEGGRNRTSLGSFFSARDLLSALGLESESSENDFGSATAAARSPSITLPPAATAAARQTPRAATGRGADGGATVGGPEAQTAAAERAAAGGAAAEGAAAEGAATEGAAARGAAAGGAAAERAAAGGAAAERAAAGGAAAGGAAIGGAAVGGAAVGRAAATAQGREATAGGGRSGGQTAKKPSGAVSSRGRLDFSMENVTLVVAEGAERAMSEMLTEMVEGKGAMKVRVVGDADLVLRTAVGPLTLRKIPVNLLQQFQCIEGLEGKGKHSLFKMSNFGVDRGLAEALHTSADLQLQMPEAVKQYSVRLGRVTLQLFMPVTEEQRSRLADFQLLHPAAQALVQPHPRLGWIIKIGDIIVEDLKIPSEAERLRALEQDGKELTLKGKAVLLPPPLNIDGEEANIGTPLLMSNYMNGVRSPLFVKGSLQSSGNPILAGYLNTMEVGIDLAGTPVKLVRKVKVERRDKLNFFATTEFVNPMKVPIRLYYVSFSPVFRGQKLSPLVIDKRDNPDVLPPEKVSLSAPVAVPIRLGTALVGGVIFLRDHVLHLGSEGIEAMGSVQVGIEDYRVTLNMHVKNLHVDG